MTEPSDAHDRQRELSVELAGDTKRALTNGRRNYSFAYALRFLVVISSIAAAVAAFLKIEATVVGSLAVIPAIVAFLSSNMKFQDRANWHYRISHAFDGLRQELSYEGPEPLTASYVAAISKRKRDMQTAMEVEWQASFNLESALTKLMLPKAS